MALYESVFIARQDISSTQAEALIELFAGFITDNGGTVSKKEYWGLKSLAFRIKKNRKGHYVLLNIDGPSAAVLEMERNMRIHEDVLRYLTVKVDELEEGPSAIMQGRDRSERGDRDRGDRDRGDRDRDRPRYRDSEERPPRPEGVAP
jgi:small subunit ribosomal protein S6